MYTDQVKLVSYNSNVENTSLTHPFLINIQSSDYIWCHCQDNHVHIKLA